MTLSKNTQVGATIVAIGLAAAAGAFAATKLKHQTRIEASSALQPGFVGTPRPGRFGKPFFFRLDDDLAAAATYLGLSQQELLQQLRSGKSLAQIANSTSGKSVSGLVDALVKATQDDLARAVKEGHLTQDQANKIAANLRARVTARVNGTYARPHFGFGGPPGGFGFRHGGRRGPTI
jgi:hypothetical protein